MKGFGHWDYADAFTGREAAHLIAGLDPSLRNPETEFQVRPIVARMKKGYYEFARELASSIGGVGHYAEGNKDCFFEINPFKRRKPSGSELWSVEIEELLAAYNAHYIAAGIPEDYQFCESDRDFITIERVKQHDEKRLAEGNADANLHWLNIEIDLCRPIFEWAHEYVHEFDDQKFSRAELHRWIGENGLPSEYKFETVPSRDVQQDVSPKSETAFLNIVGALLELYWEAAYPGQEYKQTVVLDALSKYQGFTGMGERNLKEKLTKARNGVRA